MEARLVGDGLESRHLGAGALERGRDHRSVRFVDLARAELDAGPPELAAGAEDRDPRPPAATNLRQADSGERADLGGAEAAARGQQEIAASKIATFVTNVGRCVNACGYRDHVAVDPPRARSGQPHRLRPGRASGRDPHRLAGTERRRQPVARPESARPRAGGPAYRRPGGRTRPSPSFETAAGRRGRARPRRGIGRAARSIGTGSAPSGARVLRAPGRAPRRSREAAASPRTLAARRG